MISLASLLGVTAVALGMVLTPGPNMMYLNPKAAIMYLSLIPQFVRPDQGHVPAQGFVLGGVQILVSLTVNLLIVSAAGSIAVFLARRPRWLRMQRYLMGTVLGALAVRLATERARPA